MILRANQQAFRDLFRGGMQVTRLAAPGSGCHKAHQSRPTASLAGIETGKSRANKERSLLPNALGKAGVPAGTGHSRIENRPLSYEPRSITTNLRRCGKGFLSSLVLSATLIGSRGTSLPASPSRRSRRMGCSPSPRCAAIASNPNRRSMTMSPSAVSIS